jgi:nucleotide-binding universal stress UspA family protein
MRILVGIDGSAAAQTAVELISTVTWPPGTSVRIVEVVEPEAFLSGGPWPAVAMAEARDVESLALANARTTVEEAGRRLVGVGPAIEVGVSRGRPATALVHDAEQSRADLIVVGSRGHGTIESMVLGSVSAEVVDHARCPVLVARGRGIGRVLLAWDGSSQAQAAASLIRDWPIFQTSTIRVLSIAEMVFPWWVGMPQPGVAETAPLVAEAAESSRAAHREMAEAMAANLVEAGLRADADAGEGDPAGEIVRAASDWKADLIVMGTHGRSVLGRLLIGSVARNVLHHAGCSVLIARILPRAAGGAAHI